MGCWAVPNTTAQAVAVRALMTKPLLKTDSADQLYHLVGDDTLCDHLSYAEDGEDVRHIVLNFLQAWFGETGDDKTVRESWRFVDTFQPGALAIFKEMLTEWHHNHTYPR